MCTRCGLGGLARPAAGVKVWDGECDSKDSCIRGEISKRLRNWRWREVGIARRGGRRHSHGIHDSILNDAVLPVQVVLRALLRENFVILFLGILCSFSLGVIGIQADSDLQ